MAAVAAVEAGEEQERLAEGEPSAVAEEWRPAGEEKAFRPTIRVRCAGRPRPSGASS